MSELPVPMNVRELLTGPSYLIPMYQRNYAWGQDEIRQLVRDIADYAGGSSDYHIGSLVVQPQDTGEWVTIDGQQRITTLTLLACVLKHQCGLKIPWFTSLPLSFECRESASTTLQALFAGASPREQESTSVDRKLSTAILSGYRLVEEAIRTELKQDSSSGVSIRQFSDFLFTRVRIMRVTVPVGTDLNHYFEIMNNRGEQLQAHEVVKVYLMGCFNEGIPPKQREAIHLCIDTVWDACMDMERYVQMGFAPHCRESIFGDDWSHVMPQNFDQLVSLLDGLRPETTDSESEDAGFQGLEEIIHSHRGTSGSDRGGRPAPEQFRSLIDFPNFLLHVLRITIASGSGNEVSLDDKKLLPSFIEHVRDSGDAVETSKKFLFNLLVCRFLFDRYVIKRETVGGNYHWSLQACRRGSNDSPVYASTFDITESELGAASINRRILMLLSTFHASSPSMAYKYWLNAALNHLFLSAAQGECEAAPYLQHLESVARAFVFDHLLETDGRLDYFQLIHIRQGRSLASAETISLTMLDPVLAYPAVANFTFNYLDYLLWLRHPKRFGFHDLSVRTSVEHLSPQTPFEGQAPLTDAVLHCFGNLCLINHSKNSLLNNLPPAAKKSLYPQGGFDSFKQRLMFDAMDRGDWNQDAILRHDREMKQLLHLSLTTGAVTAQD